MVRKRQKFQWVSFDHDHGSAPGLEQNKTRLQRGLPELPSAVYLGPWDGNQHPSEGLLDPTTAPHCWDRHYLHRCELLPWKAQRLLIFLATNCLPFCIFSNLTPVNWNSLKHTHTHASSLTSSHHTHMLNVLAPWTREKPEMHGLKMGVLTV